MEPQISMVPVPGVGYPISEIVLGCMMMGASASEDESYRILQQYYEMGGRWVDTADTYNDGAASMYVGNQRHRYPELKVISKVGNPTKNGRGLDPVYLDKAIHAEMERLHGPIDLLFFHVDDHHGFNDMHYRMAKLASFFGAGFVHSWGLSNHQSWRVIEAIEAARKVGLPPPAMVTAPYSMLNRAAENELLPLCKARKIGFLAYAPLARGLLSGKYVDAAVPENSRMTRKDHHGDRFKQAECGAEALVVVDEMLKRWGPKELRARAIAWVQENTTVTSLVLGVSSAEQLRQTLNDYWARGIFHNTVRIDEFNRPGQRCVKEPDSIVFRPTR